VLYLGEEEDGPGLLNVLYLGEESMVWARWVYCAKVNRKVAVARLVYVLSLGEG
jgi:hypothetical protein